MSLHPVVYSQYSICWIDRAKNSVQAQSRKDFPRKVPGVGFTAAVVAPIHVDVSLLLPAKSLSLEKVDCLEIKI